MNKGMYEQGSTLYTRLFDTVRVCAYSTNLLDLMEVRSENLPERDRAGLVPDVF